MFDIEKSARMHLVNMEKKVRKGELPLAVLQRAEGDFATGEFEQVIEQGRALRTHAGYIPVALRAENQPPKSDIWLLWGWEREPTPTTEVWDTTLIQQLNY